MSFVNSLSQTQFLLNAINSQNQQLSVLQQIVSSGGQKSQDFSGFTPAVGKLDLTFNAQIARNSAYSDTLATLATRTANIETSLTSADSAINSLNNTIVTLNNQDPTGTSVQETAQSTLEQVVDQFNANTNGVPLFSGVALNSANAPSYPIASATTLQTGLQTFIATQAPFASVAAAQAAVTKYFATTSNWFVPGAAGVPAAPAQIADDQTIQASVTANPSVPAGNPFGAAIRDTLAQTTGTAVVTASDFSDYNAATGTSATYQQWLVAQNGTLDNASTELNNAVAVNGIVRGQIGTVQTVNDTSTNLLQQGLDSATVQDVAESVTTLNNLQTQLQATYQVTAQLKGLSLANFLPA
jgi:flagellar hook-associated protein 3 FlgL